MSLYGKLEADVEIKAPANKFHEVFCSRPHHISTMSPDKIQACNLHEGDLGKEGSVIGWNYVHGIYPTHTKYQELYIYIESKSTYTLVS